MRVPKEERRRGFIRFRGEPPRTVMAAASLTEQSCEYCWPDITVFTCPAPDEPCPANSPLHHVEGDQPLYHMEVAHDDDCLHLVQSLNRQAATLN